MLLTNNFLVFSGLLPAVALARPGSSPVLDTRQDPNDIMMFDCTDYKGRTLVDLCKSMCFGSFCAGNEQSMVWDKPDSTTQRDRARAAGCRPTPNRCSKSPYGSAYQCDEFPFKSVYPVTAGTRVNRCIPIKQNQDQAQIVKAYYANPDYCNGQAGCQFNTGYENSGNIKYCNMKTCTNDGNEYTKGGIYSRDDDEDDFSEVEFASPNVTRISWSTRFETADGTEVVIPSGATVGQRLTRVSINNFTAWDEYITERIAAQASMTEEEYWEDQVAPADAQLMSLINFERTSVAAERPDY